MYAKGLLDKYRMADCKNPSTPMEKGLKLSAKVDSKSANVENPGPISKTSWSVFDQAKSLSFLLS
jgi:hypothetical protein